MKTGRNLLALVGAILIAGSVSAHSQTLTVPLIQQQSFIGTDGRNYSQWCWNASSLMILNYLVIGPHPSQQAVANWAVGGYNIPNVLFGTYTAVAKAGIPGNSVLADQTVQAQGVDRVLKQFGPVKSTYYSRALTETELADEIDKSRPVIIGVSWFTAGYRKRNGGHAVVIRGYNGGTVSINDPWPGNGQFSVSYTDLVGGGPNPVGNWSSLHRWTQALTVAGSLDLVFLIDSTGSMSDDIANVKSNVNTVIDNVATEFADYRIAVVDYKDYPQDPWGDPSDYIYSVKTPFSYANAAAAKSGINSLSASGGNDWPEAVYSALDRVIDGTPFGGWRDNPTDRRVIILGDAPGHDPEPFPGGTNSRSVLARANTPGKPIHVHTLLVGDDVDAQSTFELIGGSTGGSSWTAADASEVSTGLTSIVDEVAENPRFPRGDTPNFLPSFTFDPPGAGMFDPPKYLLLEILRFDEKIWWWRPYRRVRLKGDATSTISKTPLPLGTYQWRLVMFLPGTNLALPDGTTTKQPGGLRYETEWTEFNRTLALPGEPTNMSPYPYSFNPTTSTVTYTFTKATNATAHAVRIYRDGVLWKKLTVKEPRNPADDTRTFRVKGHSSSHNYSWEIQGLNFDRRKPDDSAYVKNP